MKIYVQSCEIAQEHGYCWLDENQKIVEEPDLIKQVRDLIESEAPSVVLAQNSKELLLLVTGLKASQRTDYRGRTIRNSVAWIDTKDTKDNEHIFKNEHTLRSLAARALRDELGENIDSAVDSRGETGFEVSFKNIPNLTEKVEPKNQHLPSKKQQIEQVSEKNKIKLALELENHCLPKPLLKIKLDDKQVVPLVVVTGVQDKETLKKAKVWREMSSLVIKDKEGEQQLNYGNPVKNAWQWFIDSVDILIPRIGISVAAVVLIPILYFAFQSIPTQSPATIPSCSAITHESLIFYVRQGEVVVGDESVIKILYNPQEIKNLVLVDKDEKPFNAPEDKTKNDGKRELTYRPKFDISEMYSVRIQGTDIATDKPICEQRIYINVRPE